MSTQNFPFVDFITRLFIIRINANNFALNHDIIVSSLKGYSLFFGILAFCLDFLAYNSGDCIVTSYFKAQGHRVLNIFFRAKFCIYCKYIVRRKWAYKGQ